MHANLISSTGTSLLASGSVELLLKKLLTRMINYGERSDPFVVPKHLIKFELSMQGLK